MARLALISAADRSRAASFAGRVALWDPMEPVRLVGDSGRVALWSRTPFGVLATRSVDGEVSPSPSTFRATDLVAALAVSTSEVVDPGVDVSGQWRAQLPPSDGWVEVAHIGGEAIATAVRAGTAAAQADALQQQEQAGHGSGTSVSVSLQLLDSVMLTVAGPDRTGLPIALRMVLSLSGMGFYDEGALDAVRVRTTRTWLRLDGRDGAVVRRRLGNLPLLS